MTVRHSPIQKSPVRFLTIVLSAALASAALMSPAHADPKQTAPAGDAVQQPYYGVLNQDNVYVRSGPSDVFYATSKLHKGAKVSVVAVREPWLKIVPPEGSYCYVARAYVEKRGDGTVGRVTKAELNVRAGSTLNGLKTTVLTSLSEGDDVKILGEQEEYFKIATPPGAYLYIMKAYVDPMPTTPGDQPIVASAKTSDPIASNPIPPAISPPNIAVPPAPVPPVAPSAPVVAPVAPPAPMPVTPAPVASTPLARTPVVTPVVSTPAVPPAAPIVSVTPTATTRPAVASSVVPATQPAVAMAPSTQPAEPSADARFDLLESDFLASTNLPIDQQPLKKLLTGYTAIEKDPSLPVSMRRITDMRVATIKLRADVQKRYLEAQKLDNEARSREVALKAEQQELAQKVKDQQVSMFTAIGTLRISSLQQSGTTMYRLTDPNTGRTLVYVKSNDPKYSDLLNQFVGVKGDINEDSNLNLRVISPTSVDAVDQAKVNTNITATVMPPSLLPKTASAAN